MPGIGHSTVAILGTQGNIPWGTGFIVAPRQVLTCAHVVGDALGDRYAIAKNPAMPAQALRVRFTVADRPTIIGAKVIRWSRFFERSELAGPDAADLFLNRDLALLELDGDSPDRATPVRFWSPINTAQLDRMFKDRQLVAAGYPKIGLDAFHSLPFVYDSPADGDEIMVRSAEGDYDEDALSGLSGAALVLRDYGLVIGLVMEVGTDRHLVVVKPARHLQEFWGDLRMVIHGSELRDEKKVPDQLLLDIDRDPHRKALSQAAADTAAIGPGVMLAAVLGNAGDRLAEWIDFLVVDVMQYKLETGLSAWVAPVRPITVYRKRGLGGNDLFRMAMNHLAKRLGIKFAGDFVSQVRAALNEEQVGNLGRTEPPPYLIFQFSARNFGDVETQVLERLIRFWDDVAHGDLDRTHLVFFTLVSKDMEQENHSRGLEKICRTLRKSFEGARKVNILDPVPGIRMDDTLSWIEDYEDELDELWHLDEKTAEQYRKVVGDIFKYEADREELPLRGFQSELEKLELCQKCQEE